MTYKPSAADVEAAKKYAYEMMCEVTETRSTVPILELFEAMYLAGIAHENTKNLDSIQFLGHTPEQLKLLMDFYTIHTGKSPLQVQLDKDFAIERFLVEKHAQEMAKAVELVDKLLTAHYCEQGPKTICGYCFAGREAAKKWLDEQRKAKG